MTNGKTKDGLSQGDDIAHEGTHAAVLQNFLSRATPFRPDATCEALVAEFAQGENRFPAFLSLYARGSAALPAIRAGLQSPDCNIRRWCALFIDNFADAAALHALVPLLSDPKAEVRLWAVHSLACETCKDGPNPIDAIPLLLDRIERDESVRVRRQAVALLAHQRAPDARVLPAFQKVLAEEADRKLRLHAQQGLQRYADAGFES